jgi:hypothetical protein
MHWTHGDLATNLVARRDAMFDRDDFVGGCRAALATSTPPMEI